MPTKLFQNRNAVTIWALVKLSLAISPIGGFPPAFAQDVRSGELATNGMVQLIAQPSRDADAQDSIFGQLVYIERQLKMEGVSVFAQIYRDRGFSSGYVGIAKKIGDFQFAVAAGPARYDDRSHFTINPWLYYAKDEVEGSVYAERYLQEEDAPWYFKGHAQKKLDHGLIVGVYGETGVGIGPMVGYQIIKSVNVKVAVPIINRADMAGIGIFTFEF